MKPFILSCYPDEGGDPFIFIVEKVPDTDDPLGCIRMHYAAAYNAAIEANPDDWNLTDIIARMRAAGFVLTAPEMSVDVNY